MPTGPYRLSLSASEQRACSPSGPDGGETHAGLWVSGGGLGVRVGGGGGGLGPAWVGGGVTGRRECSWGRRTLYTLSSFILTFLQGWGGEDHLPGHHPGPGPRSRPSAYWPGPTLPAFDTRQRGLRE